METSGKLSVFPKSQNRPVTPADMDMQTGYEGIPLTLVMDGKISRSNLPICGKDERWLMTQLKKLGFQKETQVLLGYMDTDGTLTAYPYGAQQPKSIQALRADEVIW